MACLKESERERERNCSNLEICGSGEREAFFSARALASAFDLHSVYRVVSLLLVNLEDDINARFASMSGGGRPGAAAAGGEVEEGGGVVEAVGAAEAGVGGRGVDEGGGGRGGERGNQGGKRGVPGSGKRGKQGSRGAGGVGDVGAERIRGQRKSEDRERARNQASSSLRDRSRQAVQDERTLLLSSSRSDDGFAPGQAQDRVGNRGLEIRHGDPLGDEDTIPPSGLWSVNSSSGSSFLCLSLFLLRVRTKTPFFPPHRVPQELKPTRC